MTLESQDNKKNCKYCEHEKKGGPMILAYDKKESKLYAAHLKHKHELTRQ
jgi:hypothetical protein